jgi:hypothetical protein
LASALDLAGSDAGVMNLHGLGIAPTSSTRFLDGISTL